MSTTKREITNTISSTSYKIANKSGPMEGNPGCQRFFFRSEAAVVSGEAAIVILPREKKNPLEAVLTNLTSMRF